MFQNKPCFPTNPKTNKCFLRITRKNGQEALNKSNQIISSELLQYLMNNYVNPYITDTNPSTNNNNQYEPSNYYAPPTINSNEYQPPINFLQGNYPKLPPIQAVPHISNQNIQPVHPHRIVIQNNTLPSDQIFVLSNDRICRFCRRQTYNYVRYVAGNVTWGWCCCLFFFTAILCCIPFCMDSCKDRELVCVFCHKAKLRQPANCC